MICCVRHDFSPKIPKFHSTGIVRTEKYYFQREGNVSLNQILLEHDPPGKYRLHVQISYKDPTICSKYEDCFRL